MTHTGTSETSPQKQTDRIKNAYEFFYKHRKNVAKNNARAMKLLTSIAGLMKRGSITNEQSHLMIEDNHNLSVAMDSQTPKHSYEP